MNLARGYFGGATLPQLDFRKKLAWEMMNNALEGGIAEVDDNGRMPLGPRQHALMSLQPFHGRWCAKTKIFQRVKAKYQCTMLKVRAFWIIPDVNYDISLGGNKSKNMKKREVERGSNSPKNMYVCIGDCMMHDHQNRSVERVTRLSQSCQIESQLVRYFS